MTIHEAQEKLFQAAGEVVLSGRPVTYLPKARPGEKYVLVGAAEYERLCKAEKALDSIDMKFQAVL